MSTPKQWADAMSSKEKPVTKINRIVLDLDDTINSLTMHILHRLGCNVGPFDYDKYPRECGYDIIGAWAKLSGRDVAPVPMFWEWVSRRTWEEAPRSHQFWLVDHAAGLVGEENVLIATSPTKSADCHFGKYQWMERNLPDWMQRQYSITPRKSWLAQPGTLLIDDCPKNTDEFITPPDGRPGGSAILVPRPWNRLHAEHTSSYLAEHLGQFDYVFGS